MFRSKWTQIKHPLTRKNWILIKFFPMKLKLMKSRKKVRKCFACFFSHRGVVYWIILIVRDFKKGCSKACNHLLNLRWTVFIWCYNAKVGFLCNWKNLNWLQIMNMEEKFCCFVLLKKFEHIKYHGPFLSTFFLS